MRDIETFKIVLQESLRKNLARSDFLRENTLVMDGVVFWCGAGDPPDDLSAMRRVDESQHTLRMYHKLREQEAELRAHKE